MSETDLTDEWSIPARAPLARAMPARQGSSGPHDPFLRHLEIKAAAGQRFEAQARTAEALRAATSELRLWQQLSRLIGTRIDVQAGAIHVSGQLAGSYPDYLVVDCDSGWTHLVRLGAGVTVATAPGAAPTGPTSGGVLARRYRLQVAALELERRREPVRVVLSGGALTTGTIDQVGRDYLQLAQHALGEPRRAHAVTARRYLPLSAVTMISFRTPAQ